MYITLVLHSCPQTSGKVGLPSPSTNVINDEIFTGLPSLFLHVVSNQIIDGGKIWEQAKATIQSQTAIEPGLQVNLANKKHVSNDKVCLCW